MSDRYEYDNLGTAIIEQAHEDYLEALLLEHKAILMLNKATRLKASVLSFYGNKWYYSLTNVDPGTLVDTARKQADYIIWQKNHRCENCDMDETVCPHKVLRANWKLWSDGRKTCIKERDKRAVMKQKAQEEQAET